jgi:hypothetical protein
MMIPDKRAIKGFIFDSTRLGALVPLEVSISLPGRYINRGLEAVKDG